MHKTWTDAETNYLKNNCGIMKDEDMAKILSIIGQRKITLKAVRRKREDMGLKKRCGRGICEMEKKGGK